MAKNILCVPLDPVHDVGLKIIRNALLNKGHNVDLLMPDLPNEEIINFALKKKYDYILVSRTLGYGVYELLAKFIDLCDAAGIRDTAKLVIGGKPITPQLAAELGFDKGFSSSSSIEEIVSYIEGKEITSDMNKYKKVKKDFISEHSYQFFNKEIEQALNIIADKFLNWAKDKTSDGILRAELMRNYITSGKKDSKAYEEYLKLCDEEIKVCNTGERYIKGVRVIEEDELLKLDNFLQNRMAYQPVKIQHSNTHPLIFKFLGSGCPIMDIVHGKICERWGVDGFLLINPSWEARYEGLLHNYLTHQNDGTITSLENILLVKKYLLDGTYLTVRAHRGLNTPETTMLAGEAGADMTKINLVYGSLGAGTDPERLGVDGLQAIKYAAEYNMPFDIPGNDELSGVPAYKTLAGLLINVMIGLKIGAKPIPKPLFCYGPHIMINGQMDKNYIDYNYAKIQALREIADLPIWPGEPIAFMTQSEERVQSANATSYHSALAAFLGVDAITIASTDEAYSRGPICVASRIDSLRAVQDAFKFIGDTKIEPTKMCEVYKNEMIENIYSVLSSVAREDNLPQAIYKGILGNKEEDGAYPGTFGKGTVRCK
ncbi:MAG TPA: cobalamin-dependent protein [Ignavibacteria bacterium]